MNKEAKSLVNGGYPLHTFEQLQEIYQNYITDENDRKNIEKAYSFILEKHQGQLRKSGEPYYHHLIEVAYILASLQAGPATIIAGLLHDVVEDTDVKIEEIEKTWGSDVAKLVDSLTKIQRLKLSKIESEDFEAEDHRKIFIGMAKDIRVIIIKLADRLHNMRTLASLKPERQIALSKETKEVFVPIAHRLGLDAIKCELADLCLKYLEPEKYKEIVKLVEKEFNVTVTDIRTLIRDGKKTKFSKGKHAYPGTTYRQDKKYAYVTLKEGDSIKVFEEPEEDKKAEKAVKSSAKEAKAKAKADKKAAKENK